MAKITKRDPTQAIGEHLLLDLLGAQNLRSLEIIESALDEAILAIGATKIDMLLKAFGEHGGISGVAVLAESHISIHTWPEYNYAAIDVFVCGGLEATSAIGVFENAFRPHQMLEAVHPRGLAVGREQL